MEVRKLIVFVALSLLILSTFISMGCGNRANQTVTLTITESDWGGNPLPPEEQPPSPTRTTQEVTRGDEIWLEFGTSQNGPATIREIRDDHVIVRFRTNGIEPIDENGGRTVMTERTWMATIKYGEIYRISTSTASSGRSWSFRFEKQDDLSVSDACDKDTQVTSFNQGNTLTIFWVGDVQYGYYLFNYFCDWSCRFNCLLYKADFPIHRVAL